MAWWELFSPPKPRQAVTSHVNLSARIGPQHEETAPQAAAECSSSMQQSQPEQNPQPASTICCGFLLKKGITAAEIDEMIKLVEFRINPIHPDLTLSQSSGARIRAEKLVNERLFKIQIPYEARHIIEELRAHPKIATVCENFDQPKWHYCTNTNACGPCKPKADAWHIKLYPHAHMKLYPHTPMMLCSTTPVFVVDSGVDPCHPDFVTGQIKELGLDGNLKEAERPLRGDSTANHGTFVASMIGGQQVGIAPGHQIISVRLTDLTAPTISNALESIRKYIDKNEHHGRCKGIVNMSFSGPFSAGEWELMQEALEDLCCSSVLVVGAAGNSPDVAAASQFPGAHPSVLVVGSANDTFEESWFSSSGHRVDLFAPGEVCGANASNNNGLLSWFQPSFRWGNGTSFASPIVCGLALQYLAQEDVDPQTLKRRLAAIVQRNQIKLRHPNDPAHAAPFAMSPSSILPDRISTKGTENRSS